MRSFSNGNGPNGNSGDTASGYAGEGLNHVPGIWDGIVWNDPKSTI